MTFKQFQINLNLIKISENLINYVTAEPSCGVEWTVHYHTYYNRKNIAATSVAAVVTSNVSKEIIRTIYQVVDYTTAVGATKRRRGQQSSAVVTFFFVHGASTTSTAKQ
jgi:hypothetical protein